MSIAPRNFSSYSGITTHRQCPQRWQYRNVQRYEGIENDIARIHLDFGNWWHALRAMDAAARGRAAGTLKYAPKEIQPAGRGSSEGEVPLTLYPLQDNSVEDALARVILVAALWWDTRPSEVQEAWVATLGGSLPSRLSYVDQRWREGWKDEIATEHPIAVELPWERELPGETTLIGVIDEVYLDTRRNLVVLRDNKTSKSLLTSNSPNDLLESQLHLYALGGAQVLKDLGVDAVSAIAYDRVRSVAPNEPKLTKAGTLSKSVTDFDLHTYVTWSSGGVKFPGLKQDGSGAGMYETDPAVVVRLSDPSAHSTWFQRTLSPLNRNVIKAHWGAANDTADDISRTRVRAKERGEASRSFGKLCAWCEFSSLCTAQMLGGPQGEYDLSEHGLRKRKEEVVSR